MLKKAFLVVCCFVALVSLGQSRDYSFGAKISPDKLKTDFLILVSSLKENHPGLYDFTPETRFDSLANECLISLTDSLTEGEFHIFVRKFIRVIGCGHTSARPSSNWYKIVSSSKKQIPIHVIIQEDELYIRNVFPEQDQNLIASRIISIDGVSADEILLELKSITEHDGVGETMIIRNIERLFQTYYIFLFGIRDSYLIEVEQTNGEIVRVSLEGKKAKKYQVKKTIELTDMIAIKGAKFGILSKSSKITFLELNSFPLKGHKRFYRKVFKRLSGMDSSTLVIDLRGNGGGYLPNGNFLLRHLMNDEFSMDFYKSQNHTKKNKHLKMSFLSKVSRIIFSTIPDRNKEDPNRNYQVRYKPIKRNHFNGEIYVITDGLTFSTASFVASKLKNSMNATIIGEESGGGEMGFNAVINWRLQLPNSGVLIRIPIYHVDIQPEMDDVGRGVIPNLPIRYNLEQRMDQNDLVIVRILELLKLK